METQIWSELEEKRATVLVLRGHEVHRLRVHGSMVTLKRNVKAVIEGLEQGLAPTEVKAKSVETLDVPSITKAEIDPENRTLRLYGPGADGKEQMLSFMSDEPNADGILRTILARGNQTFQPMLEPISVAEALLPPGIVGVLGALFWAGLYQSAGELAAGNVVEVHGRRRGLQQLMHWIAEVLGVTGVIAVGVVLLTLILGWAAKRIVKRPERTAWVPQSS